MFSVNFPLLCINLSLLYISVADRHHVDADPGPDSACHFDADPDPDPTFQVKAQILEQVLK